MSTLNFSSLNLISSMIYCILCFKNSPKKSTLYFHHSSTNDLIWNNWPLSKSCFWHFEILLLFSWCKICSPQYFWWLALTVLNYLFLRLKWSLTNFEDACRHGNLFACWALVSFKCRQAKCTLLQLGVSKLKIRLQLCREIY